MEANQYLKADILDIVFEGRNKEYGAYELRKKYNKRLIRALLITIALLVGLFVLAGIGKKISDDSDKLVDVKDVEMSQVKACLLYTSPSPRD